MSSPDFTGMPGEYDRVTPESALQAATVFRSSGALNDPEFLDIVAEAQKESPLPDDDLAALIQLTGEALGKVMGDALSFGVLLHQLGFRRSGAAGDPAASQPTP